MNRLIIKQNTITENVTSQLISKLYTNAKEIKDYEELNEIEDSQVELQGNLQTVNAYDDEVTYLETKFPNLHINVTVGRYIRFEDPTVQQIMAQNFGDGIGITTIEAAAVNGYNSNPGFLALFQSNANITSFNELKYFTNTTQIRYNTFQYCTNLESIDLRNVTRIEQQAFRGCTKLKHILNYQNVQEWGYETFTDCDLTGDYDFSASTVAINNDRALGFSNNVHLTSVVMPTGVQKLCSFRGCTLLHTVSNTDDIIDIIYNAFDGCTALKNVSFPNASMIDNNAFKSSGIESISLPSLVTHNKANLFLDCSLLTSVNLPNLQTTGDNTFQNCSSLTQISLPSLTSMGNNTFKGCSNLTTVSIPQCSVIKNSTFFGCNKLTSLTNSTITTVEPSAFWQCSLLTSINLSNCTSIGNNAFQGCTSLTSVDLSNCTSIGWQAFKDCSSLGVNQTLELTLNQTKYPTEPFQGTKFEKLIVHCQTFSQNRDGRYNISTGMSSLNYLDLSDCPYPPSVSNNNKPAFNESNNIDTVIAPPNIEVLTHQCFRTTTTRYLILLSTTPPELVLHDYTPVGNHFVGSPNLEIYVPDSAKADYLADSTWSQLGGGGRTIQDVLHGLSELPAGVWTTGLASQYLTPAQLATS